MPRPEGRGSLLFNDYDHVRSILSSHQILIQENGRGDRYCRIRIAPCPDPNLVPQSSSWPKWVLSRCLMSCVLGSTTRGWGITEPCNDHKKQLWAANELSPALSCLECAHEPGVHRISLYSRAGRRIDLDRGWSSHRLQRHISAFGTAAKVHVQSV